MTLPGSEVEVLQRHFTLGQQAFYPMGFLAFCYTQERLALFTQYLSHDAINLIHWAYLQKDVRELQMVEDEIAHELKKEGKEAELGLLRTEFARWVDLPVRDLSPLPEETDDERLLREVAAILADGE